MFVLEYRIKNNSMFRHYITIFVKWFIYNVVYNLQIKVCLICFTTWYFWVNHFEIFYLNNFQEIFVSLYCLISITDVSYFKDKATLKSNTIAVTLYFEMPVFILWVDQYYIFIYLKFEQRCHQQNCKYTSTIGTYLRRHRNLSCQN